MVTEYVSDTGMHNGYRQDVPGAGSWEVANLVPRSDLVWEVGPDDEADDLEISLTVHAYAELVTRARTHCISCDGCTRS